MKGILLFSLLFLIADCFVQAQNVFNPQDPVVTYNKNSPLGSREHPDPDVPGLQKWVRTPTIGVSIGADTFDNRSFKAYYINVEGNHMAFRIKFPYSYNNPDSADKKYPINLFLHGGGEVGCATNGGIYNNERPIWLGGELFRDRVNKNQFDGFLVYPQYVVTEGCFAGWGSAPSGNFRAILAMIDSMARYIRADIDRLLVDGLSGGGYGAWRMVDNYPQRVAKIMPSASAGSVSGRTKFVHIPIWFATGGKDVDPSPAQAQYNLQKLSEIGADIRYTVYPELGHSVWYQHWREPDFVPEMNNVHKANPLVFFQRYEFCTENDVDARLGLTPGFYAYEWQRNGVTIASSTGGTNNIDDPETVLEFTGNEIVIHRYGTYRARFRRTSGSAWSDWSLRPAVIKTKGTTESLPIEVQGNHSRVLPALDGSTTVPLTLAPGFINYQWVNAGDEALLDTNQVYNAPVGEYKGRYEEQRGCGTIWSPAFKVVDANGAPKPDAAINLTAVPASQSSVKLSWTQGIGETGFEVYRSTSAGGPYQFDTLLAANVKTYEDKGLVKNTVYHYRVRAVSETGAAEGSNEASAKTLIDDEPPTAPSGLNYRVSSATAVRLQWTVSTDNEGVARYDIYVNGKKLYSSFENFFVVSHLDSLIPYNFVVRAVDAAGNLSQPSNQTTYLPPDVSPGDLPGIPSEVAAEAIAFNKIKIVWTDTSANESGFEVVRSETSSGTYKPIVTVAANIDSFVDNGLEASTTYYYRVRAIAHNGESAFSPKVNARTLEQPATPDVPPVLTGDASSGGAVSLTWEDESANETGYEVYRSQDSVDFTVIASLPANSNAYADNEVSGFTYYYYYIVAKNSAGTGPKSNTLRIRAGNNAPAIEGLNGIFVKAGTVFNEPFTVSDDAGDVPTVKIENYPPFVSLVYSGSNNYYIKASPAVDNTGMYNVRVIATDSYGKADTALVMITVGDQKTRSVLVNFAGDTTTGNAPAPWNNWLGMPAAGSSMTSLKDETNTPTSLSVTFVNAWWKVTRLGHLTGDNSGVFPDAVLRAGIADTVEEDKQIIIGGLNQSKLYNIVLVGSHNEGYTADAAYSSGARQSHLNARYNTTQTANLNSITPDANGQILVTVRKGSSSSFTYLNAISIEEYDPSILLLGPNNIYTEVTDRTTATITWSDRTENESADNGYELVRATDSLFRQNVTNIMLPGNSTSYTNTGLSPDTKYWYRVRARSGSSASDYSKRVSFTTPQTIVYVNFNTAVPNAPSPWNNTAQSPIATFTMTNLRDQSGKATTMDMTLEKMFNGENTGGRVTGNNSGVVPDRVLESTYWLDNQQLCEFRLTGLNHAKRYRFGFVGSSGLPVWFAGNYTGTYTVNDKTVYLNAWMNTTKIVYINDVAPDPDGKLLLDFSTSPEAAWGFAAGVIIQEYSYTEVPDTIPGGDNPPPVDTIPGGDNPPPVDTIPGGDNPPIDTIPGGDNPPVDTIPGGDNPPIDTIPGGDNPPIDSIPQIPPPVDSIPPAEADNNNFIAYPNPFTNTVRLLFYNKQATDKILVEIHDSYGRLVYRRDFGTRPVGNNVLEINAFSANLRTGLYFATLRVNEKLVRSVKIIKMRY